MVTEIGVMDIASTTTMTKLTTRGTTQSWHVVFVCLFVCFGDTDDEEEEEEEEEAERIRGNFLM